MNERERLESDFAALEVKLTTGWRWLDDNQHRPDFAVQEQRYLGLLSDYCTLGSKICTLQTGVR